MLQKVALHIHNQHVYLFRRLLRRRADPHGLSKPFRRRNGWVVNPRQGDPAALIVEDKWWHDNSKSPYWAYFQCNDSYNERSHAGVAFYDEFHMPRVVFDDLQQMFSGVKGFQDKKRGEGGRGMRTQPLLLKVCSLVYILTDGGARPVYRAAQRACLSPQTVRKFHHAAITHVYFNHLRWHVYLPRTQEELQESESKFQRCGFAGAFCSMDVVHAPWHQCPHGFTHTCKGKEGFPTLAWNCAIDRTGLCIHISGPHHGARNDKTIAMVDELIQALRNGTNPLFANYRFSLTDKHGNVKHVYGVYALVDGGYHFWRVLICGNSFASDVFSARFAKRLESVHKDPERFFGIIKKRFHSIDGGMRWRDPKQHHYAFCLCCMLHSMIARHRKYHTVGQDPDDYMKAKLVDDQLRLQRQSPRHAGKGDYMPHPVNDVAVGNVTARLREPAFFALRQALIANYEAQWEQQAVLWLKPNSQLRPSFASRGGQQCAQDTRPLLPGRGRRGAQEASRHAWISDGEDSGDEESGDDEATGPTAAPS